MGREEGPGGGGGPAFSSLLSWNRLQTAPPKFLVSSGIPCSPVRGGLGLEASAERLASEPSSGPRPGHVKRHAPRCCRAGAVAAVV